MSATHLLPPDQHQKFVELERRAWALHRHFVLKLAPNFNPIPTIDGIKFADVGAARAYLDTLKPKAT